MGRRYKVDVVATLILQGKHHGRQLSIAYFLAEALVADVVILTEIAQQIAVREEDGTGTVCPNKRCFFSKMRVKT